MKKIYFAALLALLLFPVSSAFAQHHLGLAGEIFIPVKPFSTGYKPGYGVTFMYRKFEMTRPLIMDVTAGFRHNSGKDNVLVGTDGSGRPDYRSFDNLLAYYAKFGLAWAFIPNASPYTQPYAGFDVGLGLEFEDGLINGTEYSAALRLGWMTLVNERFIFGLETKYNVMTSFNGHNGDSYTSIGSIFNHQMSLQLSATIKVGR